MEYPARKARPRRLLADSALSWSEIGKELTNRRAPMTDIIGCAVILTFLLLARYLDSGRALPWERN